MERDCVCPYCKQNYSEEEGYFCPNCGKFVVNVCSNPECFNHDCEDMNFSILESDQFCSACGSPTVFKQDGLFS